MVVSSRTELNTLPPIIGLVGYASVGKTTAANILFRRYNYAKISVSAGIYAMVRSLYQLIGEKARIQDRKWRAAPCPFSPDKTNQQFMQILGTECGRSFNRDMWVNILKLRLERVYSRREPPLFVIENVRFQNEADFVRSQHGVLIRITREGVGPLHNHISDTGTDEIHCRYEIPNDGSKEDLKQRLIEIITHEATFREI